MSLSRTQSKEKGCVPTLLVVAKAIKVEAEMAEVLMEVKVITLMLLSWWR